MYSKNKAVPSKAFNINIVNIVKIFNSSFINLGCADSSFNLPFTISQSVSSFINYPYEGGETLNKFNFDFQNNIFLNCSCERAGPLAVINFNYMVIKNCSFQNSAALDRGGAIFVISSNEVDRKLI